MPIENPRGHPVTLSDRFTQDIQRIARDNSLAEEIRNKIVRVLGPGRISLLAGNTSKVLIVMIASALALAFASSAAALNGSLDNSPLRCYWHS